MDVILVPGLWLDAASWNSVLPALERAGYTPRPLTMPGVGAPASESADIGIADWVDAVVAEIDRREGKVALVGHSGGGNVVWGAAEARPERVARVIFVDTMPPPPGAEISEFDVVDGVVPFPGWGFFDAPDVYDLDERTREETAARALSVPGRVPSDNMLLSGTARHGIPVTILSGAHDLDGLREMSSGWPRWADELTAINDVEAIKLDSGHWPQFSKPDVLAAAMVQALAR